MTATATIPAAIQSRRRGFTPLTYGWDDLALVVELSAASRAKAHATASATARRTASAHARMDEARNAHGEWSKVSVADLVVHRDGTVRSKKAKTGFAGGLAHENGKWTATHADGTITRHGNRQAALSAMISRHNKAGKAPDAQPASTIAAPSPVKAAARRTMPVLATAKSATAGSGEGNVTAKVETPSASTRPERSGTEIWGTDEGTAPLSLDEETAIGNIWYGQNFRNTQAYLRYYNGDTSELGELVGYGNVEQYTAGINTFKRAITSSKPFSSNVTLYRGVANAPAMFGETGAMIGKTFTDKGFVSTTTSKAIPARYTLGAGTGSTDAAVYVHAPAGTHALKINAVSAGTGNNISPSQAQEVADDMQEYTLAPGTKFKVLSDTQAAGGGRQIHVQVVG